jgi:hypothetical protein
MAARCPKTPNQKRINTAPAIATMMVNIFLASGSATNRCIAHRIRMIMRTPIKIDSKLMIKSLSISVPPMAWTPAL